MKDHKRGVLALLCASLLSSGYAHASGPVTGGFGTIGNTIPFFVTGTTGEEYVGMWTDQALNITGGLTATGNATINGSMTALYYAHISDARLKKDVQLIARASKQTGNGKKLLLSNLPNDTKLCLVHLTNSTNWR